MFELKTGFCFSLISANGRRVWRRRCNSFKELSPKINRETTTKPFPYTNMHLYISSNLLIVSTTFKNLGGTVAPTSLKIYASPPTRQVPPPRKSHLNAVGPPKPRIPHLPLFFNVTTRCGSHPQRLPPAAAPTRSG